MTSEDFNIRQFGNFIVDKRVEGQNIYDLFRPSIALDDEIPEMLTFQVTEYEEGRIDLVLDAMYGDLKMTYTDLDIILYINGIDNPLSIMKGDILLYPPMETLVDFRYESKNEKIDRARRNRTLGVPVGQPNKSSRTDKNRTAYLDKVAFNPTINEVPKNGVTTQGNSILIGGVG